MTDRLAQCKSYADPDATRTREARNIVMKLLGNRLTIMVGVALLLVAGSLLFAPTSPGRKRPRPWPIRRGWSAPGSRRQQGYADRIISDMKTRLAVERQRR